MMPSTTNRTRETNAPPLRPGSALVRTSRYLLLASVVMFVGGFGAGIALRAGFVIGIGGILGVILLIAAATVGQIGRAQQGRIV